MNTLDELDREQARRPAHRVSLVLHHKPKTKDRMNDAKRTDCLIKHQNATERSNADKFVDVARVVFLAIVAIALSMVAIALWPRH